MFRMRDASNKKLSRTGCAFAALMNGINSITNNVANKTLDELYEECVKLDFISSDCFIYSYSKILSHYNVDCVMTKYTYEEFDKTLLSSSGVFGLAFTKGHVELAYGLGDHDRILLDDPGYQMDTFIDDEGFFRNDIKRSTYGIDERKCSSIRLFVCQT